MGGVVDAVSDAVSSAWDFVSDAATWVFQDVIAPVLEPIMAVLGFEGYTVVSVAIHYQPLFAEPETYTTTVNQFILDQAVTDKSYDDSLYELSAVGGHTKFNKYYKKGISEYYKGLPTIKSNLPKFDGSSYRKIIWSIEEYITPSLPSHSFDTDSSLIVHSTYIGIPNIYNYFLFYLRKYYAYSSFDNTVEVKDKLRYVDLTSFNYVSYDTDKDMYLDLNTTAIIQNTDVSFVLKENYKYETATNTYTTTEVRLYSDNSLQSSVTVDNPDSSTSYTYTYILQSGEVVGSSTTTYTVTSSTDTNNGDGTYTRVILGTKTVFTILVDQAESTVTFTIPATNTNYYQATYTLNLVNTETHHFSSFVGPDALSFDQAQVSAGLLAYRDTALTKVSYVDLITDMLDSYDPNDPVVKDQYASVLPILELKSPDGYIDRDTNSAAYTTTKSLAKVFNVNIDQILEQLKASPSAAQLQTAGVVLGIKASDSHPSSKRYLWEFIDVLYFKATISAKPVEINQDLNQDVVEETEDESYGSTRQYYTVEEGFINSSLTFKRIDKTIEDNTVLNLKPNEVDIIIDGNNISLIKGINTSVAIKYYVEDLIGATIIRQAGTSEIGVAEAYLNAPEESPSAYLVTPLLKGVLDELPITIRNDLFSRCSYLAMYSGTFEDLEWYETPEFLNIVGIVIQVVGFFFGGPIGGSFTQWLIYAVKYYVISLIIKEIINMVLEAFGGLDSALLKILAIAAVVKGTTELIQYLDELSASVLLAVTDSTVTQTAMLAAQDAAFTSFGLAAETSAALASNVAVSSLAATAVDVLDKVSTVVSMSLAKDYKELTEDYNSFMDVYNSEMKELEELMEQFDPKYSQELARNMIFETPDQFMSRTTITDISSVATDLDRLLITDVNELYRI